MYLFAMSDFRLKTALQSQSDIETAIPNDTGLGLKALKVMAHLLEITKQKNHVYLKFILYLSSFQEGFEGGLQNT